MSIEFGSKVRAPVRVGFTRTSNSELMALPLRSGEAAVHRSISFGQARGVLAFVGQQRGNRVDLHSVGQLLVDGGNLGVKDRGLALDSGHVEDLPT